MSDGATKKSMVKIRRIFSQPDLIQALAIRIRVFVQEQRVPAQIELDRDDQRAAHLLATIGGKAVGTARVVMKHGDAKIGRMAVLKSYRRKGIGAALLKRAIALTKRSRTRRVYLNAQLSVIGFYQRTGFRAIGRVFTEAGIPHRKMFLEAKSTSKRSTVAR